MVIVFLYKIVIFIDCILISKFMTNQTSIDNKSKVLPMMPKSELKKVLSDLIKTMNVTKKCWFLKAEDELVAINNLDECPKNDTVRTYMKINEQLTEGLVA